MAVFLLTNWCLQRHRILGDLADLTYTLYRNLHFCGDFLRSWLPPKFLYQLSGSANETVDRLHHMHRNADGTGLVCNCPGNCLANPPCCISREFIAFAVIKFFHSFDESQISFLNQIQELHAASHVLFGNAYYKTEICLGKTFFCQLVSQLHALCQFNFLICGQKRDLADLL